MAGKRQQAGKKGSECHLKQMCVHLRGVFRSGEIRHGGGQSGSRGKQFRTGCGSSQDARCPCGRQFCKFRPESLLFRGQPVRSERKRTGGSAPPQPGMIHSRCERGVDAAAQRPRISGEQSVFQGG